MRRLTRWFGTPLGAGHERLDMRVPPPIGLLCGGCGEPVAADDDGVMFYRRDADKQLVETPWHHECMLHRMYLGGVRYLFGVCNMFGEVIGQPWRTIHSDPPHFSIRESAIASVVAWNAITDVHHGDVAITTWDTVKPGEVDPAFIAALERHVANKDARYPKARGYVYRLLAKPETRRKIAFRWSDEFKRG